LKVEEMMKEEGREALFSRFAYVFASLLRSGASENNAASEGLATRNCTRMDKSTNNAHQK